MPITKQILSKFKSNVFIETGTYQGMSVKNALELGFKEIYSIEVCGELQKKNKSIFHNKNVFLYTGDSLVILPIILKQLNEPAVFWLDAHRTNGGGVGLDEYPIISELKLIREHNVKTHTILIDDRRLFKEWGVDEKLIKDMLKEINKEYAIYCVDGHIQNDILVATVPQSSV